MNIHKNARTTPQSRALLVHRVLQEHWPVSAVALAFGISERTVYKWLSRFRAEGLAGLEDRCSTAHRRPHALGAAWLALIELLRRSQLVAAEIAARLPVPRSTVSAVLRRRGLGRLHYLNPPPPVQRYEWARPGELVHVDTKKLGRNERPSHRVTIVATPPAVPVGNSLTSPSTIARASPTSRSCPTRSATPPLPSGCAPCVPSANVASPYNGC
jgi:transposase-like protein